MTTGISELAALEWHLAHNHYPPLPTSLAPACLAAIEACNEGESERLVELEDGRGAWMKAGDLVEACHLADSVEWPDE